MFGSRSTRKPTRRLRSLWCGTASELIAWVSVSKRKRRSSKLRRSFLRGQKATSGLRCQTCREAPPILPVVRRASLQPCEVSICHLPHDLARRAHHHGTWRNFLAFWYERVGSDQAFLTDDSPVEDDGANANEAAAPDLATMQHDHMAD